VIQFEAISVRDFGVIEQADVELRNQGLVLIRGVNHDTDAADSNGSGKSTIFKALSWGLYGEVVRDGRVTDDIIRVGAKEAWVRVTFENDDHKYRVERKRKSGSTMLEFFVDDVRSVGRTTVDTEGQIHRVLGLDWQAFRNTVMYGQGDIKRFADSNVTDSERKAILKRILRLEVLDQALKVTRERLKLLRDDATTAAMEIRAAEAALAAQRQAAERVKAASERWEREQADYLSNLEEEIAGLQGQVDAMDGATERHERLVALEARYQDTLESERDEVRKTRDELTELRDKAFKIVTAKHNELSIVRGRFNQKRDEARRLQSEVEKFVEMGVCPVCKTKVADSQGTAKHREELSEAWSRALKEADTLAKDAKAAEDVYERASGAESSLKGRQQELKKREEELDEVSTKLKKVRAKLRESEQQMAELGKVSAKLGERSKRLTEARAETNPHSLADDAKDLEEAERALGRKQKVAETIADKVAPLKFWEEAWGNKGLPSIVMDNAVPLVAAAANRYLGILADGDITADISTETPLKGGGAKEELFIGLTIEGLKNVTPSGAQERKVSIAVDLALMDLVADREGAQIDMLLLDEVLDGLDNEGKSRVVDLLRHLRTVRSSVFVISHDDAIAEHFERSVTVVKRGRKAKVEA
jgi:DNA repair exonuclease SbcCD ATPase subunit